jgi:ferrous-iron efflux pump FieF
VDASNPDSKPAAPPGRKLDVGARALLASAGASAGLGAVKLVAFQLSGSLLTLASAFDSLSDMAVSLLNAWAHREARRHPDAGHPFGHGGIEVLTSLGQGLLLAGLGGILVYRSAGRLLGKEPASVTASGLPAAIAILTASALGGYLINRLLARAHARDAVARSSLSVQTDRAHYASDAITNLLSAAGLALVWYTGDVRLDALLGFVAGGFLVKLSWPILRRGASDVVHRGAEVDVQQRVREIARQCDPRVLDVHRIRTRRLGPTLFVDFHLVLPDEMPLGAAHAIGDRAMARVRRAFPESDVLVHLDPDSEPADDLPP